MALAYVRADVADQDDFVIVPARGEIAAKRASLPFYTSGTARKKVAV